MNMPSLGSPFGGNIDRKISKEELIQAIRLDIAGEIEAIFTYDAHVQATEDSMAKKVIGDIRDEEKAHVGELMALLRILDPKEAEFFEKGQQEVKELLNKEK
jgi:rubrerythrin